MILNKITTRVRLNLPLLRINLSGYITLGVGNKNATTTYFSVVAVKPNMPEQVIAICSYKFAQIPQTLVFTGFDCNISFNF